MVSKSSIILITLVIVVAGGSGFRYLGDDLSLRASLSKASETWPRLTLVLKPEAGSISNTNWGGSFVDVKVKPMSKVRLTKLLPLLIAELDKYPAGLINSDLESIVLLETLELAGVYQKSSHTGKRVYITAAMLDDPRQSFEYLHQEISAVLVHEHEFPIMQWGQHMPNFKKPMGLAALMQNETDGCKPVPGQFEKLRMVGLDETVVKSDISELAGRVFSNPKMLKNQLESDTVLRAKYKILSNFYTRLDPQYNWQF